jgi:hypothetical protein
MTCLLGVLGPTILKEAHELGNSIRPASVDISAGPLQLDGYTLLGVPSNCSAAIPPAGHETTNPAAPSVLRSRGFVGAVDCDRLERLRLAI